MNTPTPTTPAAKTVRRIVFWFLLGLGAFIFLLNSRSCETKEKNLPPPPSTITDIRVRPGQTLRFYQDVEVVRNDEQFLVFRHKAPFKVIGRRWSDGECLVTYVFDRVNGTGTWTQEFDSSLPNESGTFQMEFGGRGWMVTSYQEGEWSKDFLLSGI